MVRSLATQGRPSPLMTGQEVRGPWELACRAAARCGGSRKFPGSDCLRWKVSLHRTRTSPDRVHCLCWAWLLSLPRAQQREFTWTGVSAFSPSGPLPGGSCQRGRCWVPMSRRFPVPASAALLRLRVLTSDGYLPVRPGLLLRDRRVAPTVCHVEP